MFKYFFPQDAFLIPHLQLKYRRSLNDWESFAGIHPIPLKFVTIKLSSQYLFCSLLISLKTIFLFQVQVLELVAVHYYLQMQI